MKKFIILFFLISIQNSFAELKKDYNLLFLLIRFNLCPTYEKTLTESEYFEKLDDFFKMEFGKDLDFDQPFTEKVEQYGASDLVEGLTPLHVAIIFERFDLASYLISKGVDVNASIQDEEIEDYEWLETPLDFIEFIVNHEKLLDEKSAYFEQQQKVRQLLLASKARYGDFCSKKIKKAGSIGAVRLTYPNPGLMKQYIRN